VVMSSTVTAGMSVRVLFLGVARGAMGSLFGKIFAHATTRVKAAGRCHRSLTTPGRKSR
jgi:hypothetical protein